MSAVPFMQLYVADYLGDTQHLTTEQHGAYLLILMAMWRAGGALPSDPLRLARIARLSPSRWKKIGGEVLAFFESDGDVVTQKRLRREIAKASDISRKRSSAGARGAAAKQLNGKRGAAANAGDLPAQNQTPESNTTPSAIDPDGEMVRAIAAAGGTAMHEAALDDLSPLAAWLADGADFAAEILPVVAARCRGKRRGSVRTLAYFTEAVGDGRANRGGRHGPRTRRSRVFPGSIAGDRKSGTPDFRSAHDVLAAGMARAIGADGDGARGGDPDPAAGRGADGGDEGMARGGSGAAPAIDLAAGG